MVKKTDEELIIFLKSISLLFVILAIGFNYSSYLNLYVFGLFIYITIIWKYNNYKHIASFAFISIVISLPVIAVYSINPEGHDYNIYSERMKLHNLNDLPISWVIMKIFTSIRNPEGLYILSGLCVFLIGLLSLNHIYRNSFLVALFPIIFYHNQSIKYLAGGVVRNLIAFVFIVYYMNNNYKILRIRNNYIVLFDDIKCYLITFILALTHIPSFIYFSIYIFFKIRKKVNIILGLCFGFIFVYLLGIVFKGEILQSVLKPFEILYVRFFIYGDYNNIIHTIRTFSYHGWKRYTLVVYSAITFGLAKSFEKNNRILLPSIILLSIIIIPLFHWKIMFRFLLMSFFPIIQILKHLDEDIPIDKCYIYLLALESIGANLP